MVMNGSLLLVSRSFCAALLALVGMKYFIWYSIFDMGLYLLQKAMRRDFTYWIPADDPLGILISLLVRVVVKTITDYTGIVQFRGSAEMGGIYWSINMIMAIAAPVAVVAFYYVSTLPDKVLIKEKTAWRFVGLSSGAWMFFFLLFLKLIKKKYRRTFFSFETGNEWAMSFFLKGDTDAKRVKPLRLSEKKWKKIRPQMKEFVLENWEAWEEEQPEFFTETFKKRVPDDMLPLAELRKQKMAGGGQRRRSSLGELLGGGAPSRIESATVVPFKEGDDSEGVANEGVAAELAVGEVDTTEGEKMAEAEKKGKRYEDDDS
jgi:hypothetical protein